jgi:alanyl-tRNA synthetase
MKFFSGQEIRDTWIRFFRDKGHAIEPSFSLIPHNDNTLLWINAGVAPLKKYFDGREKPNNPRIANIQKCIRTNDIDNVGKTARHHTFFEMLGNFSIGNYFKKDAIHYAYELLTSDQYFQIPIERLYMTYYPEDQEAYDTWIDLGIKPNHLIPVEGNFWEIGPGPCGPDTEIFFDRGEGFDSRGIELIKDDIENERFIEIWNVVFSQFNSTEGLSREDYPLLPQKNIDTGAGLERFACILQNTKTNFETDLFLPIIHTIETLSGVKYEGQMAFKVIADHIKALTFAISDGAVLSNEGRGYVLRRLLRRAVKYGLKINLNTPFLHKLIPTVVNMMETFYPYLNEFKDILSKIIFQEESKFFETISEGEQLLEQELSLIDGQELSGEVAFKLYDTYGFPFELTEEYVLEKGFTVNKKAFEEALNLQKERSRQSMKQTSSMHQQEDAYLQFSEKSTFVGYDQLKVETNVIGVFKEGIVLKETPFYAESGGQISDIGMIDNIPITEVKKLPNGQFLHLCQEGVFHLGDRVHAKVDETARLQTSQNHSAAHLFHQSLKEVLGSHALQQGQQVSQSACRFDFNHYETIDQETIIQLETLVNHYIKDEPLNVNIYETSLDEAKRKGAMALFGEKYGNQVRVVDMEWSIELCGGTHVSNTKNIQQFAITSLSSIGSGIYRMEGITGHHVQEKMRQELKPFLDEIEMIKEKIVSEAYDLIVSVPEIKGTYMDIINFRTYIEVLRKNIKDLEKQKIEKDQQNILSVIELDKYEKNQDMIVISVNHIDKKVLKSLVDQAFDYLNPGTLVLFNIDDQKASYVIKSSKQLANVLVKKIASMTEGSGGGQDHFAQGGTSRLDLIDDAMKALVL